MYTLTEAAKAVGKSRAALSKAIRTGKLVASKDSTGRYVIAPVDLHKAYPVNAVADNPTSATDNQPTGDPANAPGDPPAPVVDNLTNATDNQPAGDPGGSADTPSEAMIALLRSQPDRLVAELERKRAQSPGSHSPEEPGQDGPTLGDLRSDLADLRSALAYSIQQVNATLSARPGFLARSLMALPVAWCVLSGVYVAGFFLAFGPNAFWRVGQLSFSALIGTLLSYWPF